MSGSIFPAGREMVSEAGTGLGCTGIGSTERTSMSALLRGLGAMRRGFLPEPPGAGVRILVLLTGSGGS